jgi:regulator of PEP synthase PpsR (kinase-PPPase family)
MGQTNSTPAIFILSGGVGASGEQLVHTLLAQFPEDAVQVTTIGHVREPQQVTEALGRAQQLEALVAYTLVDPALHDHLRQEAERLHVQAVDLMGPIMAWVTARLGIAPKAQPGLYRHLHAEYFERVSAIDFTMDHDDGKNPHGWPRADAVLVGASRVGKTPLSLYLAILGWKIANYPLVPQVPIPEELFSLDLQRLIGITVEPDQLLQYRASRQAQLGAPGPSPYADTEAVYQEVEAARKIFRKGGFKVIDMSDKTIEQGADEIIRHLSRLGK